MASELQFLDRANQGLSTYYALVTDDRAPTILINSDGTRVNFTTATNTIIRAAARPMLDTGHPGFYFADLGTAANGRYRYSVFVTPSAPASAHATTTDQLAAGSEPEIIDWIDGDVAPAAGAGNMSLTDARAWVRQFARGGGSATQYSTADIDHAIITVAEQFCRKTRAVQTAGTVALSASSAVADVSGLTLFRPERILHANILTKECEIDLIDWEEYYRLSIDCTGEGEPRKLAFETSFATTGAVWPTPDAAYSLRLRFWQSFSTFTPGTASDATTTFNIPDDWLGEILTWGAPAILQGNDPKYLYANESWKKYLAWEATMVGAGNRGAKVLVRQSVRDVERQRRR